GGRGGDADGTLSGDDGTSAARRGPRHDRSASGTGGGVVVSAKQRGADGLPAVSSGRSADDKQSGRVASRGVQYAGERKTEVLESARGCGSGAASAGGVVERGWAVGAILLRTPRQSLPAAVRLIARINRRTVHDLPIDFARRPSPGSPAPVPLLPAA